MNNKNNDGGPAFPTHSVGINELNEGVLITTGGATLRDYFAAAALQGILARGQSLSSKKDEAVEAFQYSGAMLKAREAKP
jgi:hypothetical protein